MMSKSEMIALTNAVNPIEVHQFLGNAVVRDEIIWGSVVVGSRCLVLLLSMVMKSWSICSVSALN